MDFLDDLKNLPHNIVEAIRKITDSDEEESTPSKISFAGLKLVIKTGADDVDYDEMSLSELEDLLDKLEIQLLKLQDEEPEEEDSEEYEEWEEAVEELEDLIDEVQAAIDEREEE
jgi:hypothetical protein